MLQACIRANSFLWFSRSLSKRQKRKIVLARVNLLKKLQGLQQRKKNILFFEELRNRKLLSALYGGLSQRSLKKLKKKICNSTGNQRTKSSQGRCSSGSKTFSLSMVKNLLISLEMRLDTILFRMNFFSSFSQVRQCIKHGKIVVQGKLVRSTNYRVKPGQIVGLKKDDNSIREKIRKDDNSIREEIRKHLRRKNFLNAKPSHLEVNYKLLQGLVLFSPQQVYYPTPFKIHNPSLTKDHHRLLKKNFNHRRKSGEPRALVNPRKSAVSKILMGSDKKIRRKNNALSYFFTATRKKALSFFSPDIAVSSL